MPGTTAVTKFVSKKVSKVRWRPAEHLKRSDTFVSGSWDDEENCVAVWSLDRSDVPEGDSEWAAVTSGEPVLLCDIRVPGSVTDMQYLKQDLILTSSSLGGVSLIKHHRNSQTLSAAVEWKKLHSFVTGVGCACTGIASQDDHFVTVGEDGRLCLLHMEHRTPVRSISKADGCCSTGVCALAHQECATINSNGHLKVWDLREKQSQQPSKLFLPSSPGERFALNCIDRHPTQPHVVATGGQDGALVIWDMRQERFPVTILSAHASDMWEVRFHPSHPNNLFTCSEDGSVWHWNAGKSEPTHIFGSKDAINSSLRNAPTPACSPWLTCQASKNQLDITDLLPGNSSGINSVDVVDYTVICGSDVEQIICVRDLVVT